MKMDRYYMSRTFLEVDCETIEIPEGSIPLTFIQGAKGEPFEGFFYYMVPLKGGG